MILFSKLPYFLIVALFSFIFFRKKRNKVSKCGLRSKNFFSKKIVLPLKSLCLQGCSEGQGTHSRDLKGVCYE